MGDRIPVDLDEAVRVIVTGLDEESLKAVKNLKAETARALGHHGIGLWIRNNWGLNQKTGPLYRWAVKHLGLYHPDDISNVVVHCVWADLGRNDRDLDEVVQRMKDHWTELGCRPDGSKLFDDPVDLLQHGVKKPA